MIIASDGPKVILTLGGPHGNPQHRIKTKLLNFEDSRGERLFVGREEDEVVFFAVEGA